uniref:WLM domain-containing protein n=1 Tax=Opuntia streptacantha TaxID=393608 RepID=A0A7C8YT53_OPUST
MVQLPNILSVHVVWKGRKFVLEQSPDASLKELGEELQALTDVKADTLRLIIPQSSSKSSKLFMPFSEEHSCIKLQDAGIAEGKPVRMMGVYELEINQLLKDAKVNLRIAGFEDEEKRLKQRISRGPQVSFKLPQGPYIFCDFRTLELPGIQLNPPPLEALKRMHMLASDPGIVAIMNKHHWRVGIMTEMAPVGYVGISPKCLLGFNKNHGEEISLRLRTDDLKGFRKYESIKKTLLHELAHMDFAEHDSNFYALNKQLNQEAFALDWTKSRSHTLGDTWFSGHDDMDMDFESENSSHQKVGGGASHMVITPREASVAAAYHRLADSSTISQGSSAFEDEDSDDRASDRHGESKSMNSEKEKLLIQSKRNDCSHTLESEPDPDDSRDKTMNLAPYARFNKGVTEVKLSPGDAKMRVAIPEFKFNEGFEGVKMQEEPGADDAELSDSRVAIEPHLVDSEPMQIGSIRKSMFMTTDEPDPDDSETRRVDQPQPTKVLAEPDPDDALVHAEPDPDDALLLREPDPNDAQENTMQQVEPDPDDTTEPQPEILGMMTDEADPDDQELRRIQDPVRVFCNQLTKAIKTLHSDLRPSEVKEVLETLFKIIRNASQNPNEMKYKKLRKANPVFQRTIASYKAAMEVLHLIGFNDDVFTDETGKSETYLVLKRNDPGLLWLAKSTLEVYISE